MTAGSNPRLVLRVHGRPTEQAGVAVLARDQAAAAPRPGTVRSLHNPLAKMNMRTASPRASPIETAPTVPPGEPEHVR